MRITKENLTRYDQHFKSWHRRRLGCANALESWHQTEEAGVVQFYPVGGSPLEGKVKFSFTETPPAEGDKGPENPSTISGVNSVGVADRSKNIYDFPNLSAEPYNGVTITCDADGTITLNGTCNLSSSQSKELYYTYPVAIKTISQIKVIASIYHIGGTYGISGSDTDTPVLVQIIRQSLTTGSFGYIWLKDTGTDQTSIQSWTVSNAALISCSLRFFGGAVYNNYKIKVQYEISSDSTVPSSYEPPARDAFAVIPLGSTYYGGTLDVASGLMTVNVGGSSVSTFTSATLYTNTVQFGAILSYSHYGNTTPSVFGCNRFDFIANNSDVEHWRQTGSAGTFGANFYISKSRLDVSNAIDPSSPTDAEWLAAGNAWLANNPIFVVSSLYTPYTVQLTPLQLTALAQTSRHEPRLNTVYTDADSIQITYQKSPIRAATEQEMAILGLGGNV